MQVNLVHTEFVIPMIGSHDPPLAYMGLITFSPLSLKLKNDCPLFLLVWNDVCQCLRRLSHSFFLLNRYKFLLGRVGRSLASLTSLSTTACYKTQFGRCIMERI